MRARLIILLAAALCSAACRPSEDDYLAFLYESMPLPDSLVFPESYWRANVAKTLEVRDRMDWDIPEREFRHFVLPLRVNNENLDDFRTTYADSLCERVEGMDIAQAALEINHWCHERATYTPSDGRTLGPMALIRSGLGRCGEESVLTVAALRAAGIPARQVYTPRWAHTDDNHAWVEVFANGAWHFMGACEPESVLDLAWFNSSVSRAMLLHTKVFGRYKGPEDIISRTAAYTEINCISSYIPIRRTAVTVRDTLGRRVEGANVEFRIYNYAEFYRVASYQSDRNGRAALDTGIGDILVWAHKDGMFGVVVARGEQTDIVLDRHLGQPYSIDLDIVPPAEDPLPDRATAEQKAANALRLEQENAIRATLPHPRTYAPELFLSAKDAIDVTDEVIEDARAVVSAEKFIACPRVELEMLLPYRREILESGIAERISSPSQAAAWVRDSISVDDSRNPQRLRIPPVAIWRSRQADSRSRDIFFVALCRTLGFAARLDEATLRPEYRVGDDWVGVDFGAGTEAVVPKASVTLSYAPEDDAVKQPEYYRHFTFSQIIDGSPRLCEFDENAPTAEQYLLDEGYYLLTSGTRLANGAVLAHLKTFVLGSDGAEVPLVLRRASDEVRVIGNIDAEARFRSADGTETSLLETAGRGYFLLCITGVHDEPTVHALGQMAQCADALNAWDRKIIVLDGARPEGLESVVGGSDPDGRIAQMLLDGIHHEGPVRLPLIAIADSFGRVVYFSEGYNTSLAAQLTFTLGRL